MHHECLFFSLASKQIILTSEGLLSSITMNLHELELRNNMLLYLSFKNNLLTCKIKCFASFSLFSFFCNFNKIKIEVNSLPKNCVIYTSLVILMMFKICFTKGNMILLQTQIKIIQQLYLKTNNYKNASNVPFPFLNLKKKKMFSLKTLNMKCYKHYETF